MVRLLSHVQLFVTPWTAAHQASLSITNSRSLLKLMSIELVMPSNHLILCCSLLLLPSIFPRIRIFSNIAMNIQGWFPLGLTGLISLQSMGLSKLLSTWMNVNLGVQYLSFYEDFVFLESFRFTAEILIYLWPPTSIISPVISIPHQTVQFVKVINLYGHILIT